MEQQASSFSSGFHDASEVPAKDGAVCNFTGTKSVELIDQVSLTKFASTDSDQLPPVLSMIVDGFPPMLQSKFVNEAEKRLEQYVERYPNAVSLAFYCRKGLSAVSYIYPGVIDVDRLVVITITFVLLMVVDDLFIDTPGEFLRNQYGVSRSACASPEKIQEYLDRLYAIFKQQVQPSNPAPLIETLTWELGRDTLELSNHEWFNHCATCLMEFYRASVDSEADIVQSHNLCFKDLKSYTIMRVGNAGGDLIQSLIELANNTYIPSVLRASPYFEYVTMATSIHIGFANDVFSYHKESVVELQNPRNLIKLLMDLEGRPFAQAAQMAIDLTNTYARAILDLEAQAWNPTLQNHLQDIKVAIAGNVYFSFMDKGYRHPDSAFPEMRDMTLSWKILPEFEAPGL